jgi:uncharacterized protein YdhG (YjbR/CyaY superfamily)
MDSDIANYLKGIPESRKLLVAKLHSLIMKRFPNAELTMKYKMPTYALGEGWVAVANQKNYVSLYTCGVAHLVEFRKAYPQYRTGTGCINFRETQEIPEAAVTRVIEHAMLHRKEAYRASFHEPAQRAPSSAPAGRRARPGGPRAPDDR